MRLIAWTLRLLGCVVLAFGVVLAVGDIARSIAADRVALLSIDETLEMAHAPDEPVADASAPTSSGVFAGQQDEAPLRAVVGAQPASVVMGLLGLVLIALGRPARRDRSSFAPRRSRTE